MRCITHVSSIPTSNLPEFQGQIEVNDCVKCPIEANTISRVVGIILADAGFDRGTISIAIVDDLTIHRINRDYLNHDYPTDVLSFRLDDDAEIGLVEGEVIVSYDTALRESVEFNWNASDELLLYIIHGTLHLTGRDDKTDSQRLEMRAAENQYLARLGISRPDAESE